MKYNVIRSKVHGIDVVYMQVPNLFTAYVGFHSLAGSYGENDQNSGVAHYLEHMFFKGTKTRTWEDIAREGSMLGGIQNACTGQYKVSYYLSGLPQDNFEGALDLLSDMMFNSTLPQSEIDSERSVIQEELKMHQDNHNSHFFGEMAKRFHNSQTSRTILGDEGTLEKMSRETLEHYYKTQYGQDNTVLLIIGSMPVSEVKSAVNKHLKGNEMVATADPLIEPEIVPMWDLKEEFDRSAIQQTYICEHFRVPDIATQDIHHEMFHELYGGGMNSLLFREIREKQGLCYNIGTGDWLTNGCSGVGILKSGIDASKVEQFKDAVQEVKDGIIANGFDEQDFLAGKNAILGEFCRAMQTPESMAMQIANFELFGVDFDFNADYEDCRNVDLNAVNEYAKEFLTNMQSNWCIMRPTF